jgi:membrane fusion protein (multidrug efflux system)
MLDNPDGRILPGMFARVELVKEVYPQALVIPLYAVIAQGEQHCVFVENGGLAKKRFIQLGALEGWQVQVVKGLSPQEKVIVVGHRLLEEGQPVEVLKTVHDPREIIGS